MTDSCPQCRSTKTTHHGLFDGWACEWCGNEWTDLSADEIGATVEQGDRFRVETRERPLTVDHVDGWRIYLDGQRGGSYYLRVRSDGSASFHREKAESERNQFGSRWQCEEQTIEFEYLDAE